jgi:hypothetical protein
MLLSQRGRCGWLPDLPAVRHRGAAAETGRGYGRPRMHRFNDAAGAGRTGLAIQLRIVIRTSPSSLTGTEGIDYVGLHEYEGPLKFDFHYRLADIVNAALEADLPLIALHEYPPRYFHGCSSLGTGRRVQLSFLLQARKPPLSVDRQHFF